MAPRTQMLLVGGLAGAAAWTAWFLMYAQGEGKTHLAAVGAAAGPGIAEDAAKSYIAERYGLTPAILARITSRAGLITSITSALHL